MPVLGLGATIFVNDGSGGAGSASAEIVDVLNFTVPDYEVGVVESKRLNQSDRVIRKLAAMREPGQFSFQYEFSTGKKTRLDALVGSDRVFVITVPTDVGSAWTRTAPGFIVSNKIDSVVADGITTATCTIQVSAAVS
jgi:hypothetical protein